MASAAASERSTSRDVESADDEAAAGLLLPEVAFLEASFSVRGPPTIPEFALAMVDSSRQRTVLNDAGVTVERRRAAARAAAESMLCCGVGGVEEQVACSGIDQVQLDPHRMAGPKEAPQAQ